MPGPCRGGQPTASAHYARESSWLRTCRTMRCWGCSLHNCHPAAHAPSLMQQRRKIKPQLAGSYALTCIRLQPACSCYALDSAAPRCRRCGHTEKAKLQELAGLPHRRRCGDTAGFCRQGADRAGAQTAAAAAGAGLPRDCDSPPVCTEGSSLQVLGRHTGPARLVWSLAKKPARLQTPAWRAQCVRALCTQIQALPKARQAPE